MDLLIADSGSTKTDWVLVRDGKETSFRTEGFNPWQISADDFRKKLQDDVLPKAGKDLSGNLVFYGAGCGTQEKQELWKNTLHNCFPVAIVEVHSDLLGAARALCGKEPGIVAILGTGSNSCFYDGEKIAKTRPSPGYIFGDEGGGTHIGKTFLAKYLSGNLNSSLTEKFEKETGMNTQKILDGTYKQPHANRFLASFASFVIANASDEQCRTILDESFSLFNSKHILHYDVAKYKVNVTGSVGIHCREILEESWKRSGIRPGIFMEKPVEGMVRFHLEK